MLQNAYRRKMIIGIVLEERLRAGSRAALRQTKSKSVWHSARNGSIAHILQGGEKAPWLFGGLFRRLKKRERREVEGRGIIKAIKGIALVGAKKVSPPQRAILKITDLVP
jgi:hypothetical protein